MTDSVLQYLTQQGDRWDLIAHQYYGNATLIDGLISAKSTSADCRTIRC